MVDEVLRVLSSLGFLWSQSSSHVLDVLFDVTACSLHFHGASLLSDEDIFVAINVALDILPAVIFSSS